MAEMSRTSAGIRSPLSISIMSPGTSWSARTSRMRLSRRTLARGAVSCFRAASDASALASCIYPKTALIITMAAIATASASSPKRALTAVATRRTMTIKSWNCCRKISHLGFAGFSASLLGPQRCRRRSASLDGKPDSQSVLSRWATSSLLSVCQR